MNFMSQALPAKCGSHTLLLENSIVHIQVIQLIINFH